MKIDHIAVYVSDLEESRRFYEKYFGAVSSEKYHNLRTGLQTYFLTFEGNSRLEIMSRPEVAAGLRDKSDLRTGYTHLAFGVGGRNAVDSLTARLERDGCSVARPPRITGDGYYESVVLDNDGNEIELTV